MYERSPKNIIASRSLVKSHRKEGARPQMQELFTPTAILQVNICIICQSRFITKIFGHQSIVSSVDVAIYYIILYSKARTKP